MGLPLGVTCRIFPDVNLWLSFGISHSYTNRLVCVDPASRMTPYYGCVCVCVRDMLKEMYMSCINVAMCT